MAKYVNLKDYEVEPKHAREEALNRWRYAFSIVKNSLRRFHTVPQLVMRSEALKERLRQLRIAEENNDTEPILGSTETENSLDVDIEENNSIRNHEADSRNNVGGGRKVDLGWIFVITNLVLELPSAVFDQLSSMRKPQYALFGMLISFLALLICFGELAYKAGEEKVIWKWKGKSSGFYSSLHGTHKRFGGFKDVIGLVCALAQSVVTTINCAFCLQHADSPIKISVWPIIFAFGLLCSKFLENSERRITS